MILAKSYYFSSITTSILVTIVFIVLKLCNVIGWSWWLVMLPSIIEIGISLIVIIILFIIGLIQAKEDF